MNRTSFVCGLAAVLLFAGSASAQIYFGSGSPYTQNFDSLANSGTANTWTDNSTLPGWYASKTLGGAAVTGYRADTGTSTAGAIYSYGASGSTERALGSIGSGTPGNFAYGVCFTNDTDQMITNLTVNYTGEQWRNGGNTAVQTLSFSYQISWAPITTSDAAAATTWTAFPALSFNSPIANASAGALDGNAGANRQVFNVLMPDVVVYPGQEIFFRWLDINDSGNDHGLAIDDLSISFTLATPYTNPPAITAGPPSMTNNAGTTAFFTVTATGSALTYQWRRDGYDIYNDGFKYAGCQTPMLMVSNVLGSDTASYRVVVGNGGGSVTSAVAILTVIDPAIISPPVSRSGIAGDNASFAVGASGMPLLSYQWRFNGADITDATTSRLTVTNIQSANQGSYTVVVTNGANNSITSAVATLTIAPTPSTLLAAWNFNGTNSLAADSPAASTGTGTASLLFTKGAFSSGSFSDPVINASDNGGWNSSTYASQGTSNKVTGVQFNVSTLGYQDLFLTWEERHSATASKYVRLQYTSDNTGTNFTDGPLVTMTATDGSFVFYSANLAAVPALNNNPNCAFRLVSEFESTATGTNNDNYVATAGSYSGGGTIRYDLVRVFANTAGTVTRIPLHLQQFGSDIVLTWSNPSLSLASSTSPLGPFTKVSGATSPYTNTSSATTLFFELLYP